MSSGPVPPPGHPPVVTRQGRLTNPALTLVMLRIDRVATGTATAMAVICLAVASSAGLWQVAARFLFGMPLGWSEALVRTALIWMVMLGLAAALRQGALVSIDLAERLSRGAVQHAIRASIFISNLTALILLGAFGAVMTARVAGQTLSGLEVSIAFAYAAIPVGCAFAIVGVVAHSLDRRHAELEAAQ